MNAKDLMAKAEQAAASAKVLLDTSEKDAAAWAVQQAQVFVTTMQATFLSKPS